MSERPEHPDAERYWRNQKLMAWASLLGILAIAGASAFGVVSEHASPILRTTQWVLVVVIGYYSLGTPGIEALAKVRGGGRA